MHLEIGACICDPEMEVRVQQPDCFFFSDFLSHHVFFFEVDFL